MKTSTVVILVLLGLALVEFSLRGPVRFAREGFEWNDLTQVYTPSRAWLEGLNPYSPENFVRVWAQQSGVVMSVQSPKTHDAYPITTLVIMAPLAAFSWTSLQTAWTVIRLGLLAIMLVALVRLAKLDLTRSLVLAVIVLAWAPFHTGFATGNVTIAAVELAIIGMWVGEFEHWFMAGCLLGVSACLKPQIGICFLLYYLVRGRWRIFATTSLFVLLIIAIGAARLHGLGTVWVSDFIRNGHDFVTANRVDDFADTNPMRFTLISLQVPLYEITQSRTAANVMALGSGAVMTAIWLALILRHRKRSVILLEIGALSVISLFAAYHRFYDAVLLILPLSWTLTDEARQWPKVQWALWILSVPFLVPGAALLQTLLADGRLPASLGSASAWNAIVMPHEAWLLFALGCVSLYAMRLAIGLPALPLELAIHPMPSASASRRA